MTASLRRIVPPRTGQTDRRLGSAGTSECRNLDGGVTVLSRGYSADTKSWKEAEGKAYFVRGSNQGYLKVSFFGPFYGSYIVFELDHAHYQHSLVCGPDKSYLWILARSPRIDRDTKDALIQKAAALGFDTSRVTFVDQD